MKAPFFSRVDNARDDAVAEAAAAEAVRAATSWRPVPVTASSPGIPTARSPGWSSYPTAPRSSSPPLRIWTSSPTSPTPAHVDRGNTPRRHRRRAPPPPRARVRPAEPRQDRPPTSREIRSSSAERERPSAKYPPTPLTRPARDERVDGGRWLRPTSDDQATFSPRKVPSFLERVFSLDTRCTDDPCVAPAERRSLRNTTEVGAGDHRQDAARRPAAIP